MNRITILVLSVLLVFSAQGQLKKPTSPVKKETIAKPPVKVVERVKIVEKDNDKDNDGIIDSMDKCPDEWGELKNEGCPKNRNLYGLTDSNGSKYDYEGEVLNGLPNGKGKATYIEGHHVSFYGIKTININKGDVYIGDFSEGKLDGIGTFIGSEETYNGYWRNDKKNGFGKMIYSDSTVYEGNWLDNKRHGIGKFTWTDGNVYEGDWKDDVRSGKGKNKFQKGDIYEGDFINGERSGKGLYLWADGSKYIGDWKDNKRHGKGEYYNEAGVLTFKGEYKDDKHVGGTNILNNTANKASSDDLNYIRGKVVDKHGYPIIGASILALLTNNHETISNVEGEFEIRLYLGDKKREDAILQFKYIGCKTKKIVLGDQTYIKVVLK